MKLIAVAAGILLHSLLYSQRIMTDYTGIVFPPDNALNMPIDSLPVHPNSDNLVASIGLSASLHPDFGTSYDDGGTLRPMGIPYNVVGAGQPFIPITYTLYGDESDPGPWPIPNNPFIETVFDWRESGTGDRHMLIVDSSSHILYETGNVSGNADGTIWEGGCGAVYDLNSNNLRPETWTSADAAGLPIFPLLIRYDEVERAMVTGGAIPHALRFTVANSQRTYLWPARHYASSSTNPNRPPMGLRFRLKAEFDITGYSPRMQVILRTMKKYGLIVADNGSNWFFQGTNDDRWDNEEINTLKNVHGSDFEAIDIGPWLERPGFNPNSGAVPPDPAASLPAIGGSGLPTECRLYQNYPNPFNPSTTVEYDVPAAGFVRIRIFNCLGQEVASPVNAYQRPGKYSLEFNAGNIPGGIYFYRLQVNHSISTLKMVLLK